MENIDPMHSLTNLFCSNKKLTYFVRTNFQSDDKNFVGINVEYKRTV